MNFKSFWICIIATGSATSVATAQPADLSTAGGDAAAKDTIIQEIVVTAERRSESAATVPMSINAISGDQLHSLGIQEVSDLQKIVPGFHFSEATYSAPIYAIRGIGFNDSSLASKPTVALSVNEVPLPFPIMAGGVNFDLQRIEVLKGPQGTLYGQNATGGAINFIAAQPTRTFEAGVDADYGRFNSVNLEGFVSGPISDTLSARIALRSEQSDGWQKSYTRSDTLGKTDKLMGRLLLDWRPTNDVKIELMLGGFTDKSDTQAAQLVAVTPLTLPPIHVPTGLLNYPLAPANDRAADWDPGVSFAKDDSQYQTALRLDYQILDGLALTSISAYSHFNKNEPVDFDGTSYQDYFFPSIGKVDVVSQEIRLSGSVANQLNWIVGGNYEHDKVDQSDEFFVRDNGNAYALTAFGPPYFYGFDLSTQKITTSAAFANADWNLSQNFTLHGGARYTKADIDHTGCTADGGDGALSADFGNFSNFLRSLSGLSPNTLPANGGCVTLGSAPGFVPENVPGTLNQSNVSWRTGIDWKPDDTTLTYINVSKGFKSGGYPILAASTASQFTPVTQESVLAYEAGFKTNVFDRSLQLNGALFYYDYRDKQLLGRVIVPVFGALAALVNVPKSEIKGAELQVVYVPLAGLKLSVGGSYIDSRIEGNFVNFNPFGVTGNFTGEAFPLTPKWQISTDAQYDKKITDIWAAFVGSNVSSQSSTNGGLGELESLKIDAYTLVDVRAGVYSNDGAWRFSVWGRNITDKYYWTNADHGGNTTVRFAGMPATFGLSVAFRYH